MYARHSRGDLLELELGDFKEARRFRILAFDDGYLSFADYNFHSEEGPGRRGRRRRRRNVAALVTSPKNPLHFSAAEDPRYVQCRRNSDEQKKKKT